MNEDMNPEVLDAAIIACAQKIEHYEICGYGTAKAYARELNLTAVERLLDKTLNEEYDADDRLTDIAVGGLNQEAETGARARRTSNRAKKSAVPSRRSVGNAARGAKISSKKATPKTAKKSAPSKKSATPKKGATSVKKSVRGVSSPGSKSKGLTRSAAKKAASTRMVKAPGGRAGTSHRGPRGH